MMPSASVFLQAWLRPLVRVPYFMTFLGACSACALTEVSALSGTMNSSPSLAGGNWVMSQRVTRPVRPDAPALARFPRQQEQSVQPAVRDVGGAKARLTLGRESLGMHYLLQRDAQKLRQFWHQAGDVMHHFGAHQSA